MSELIDLGNGTYYDNETNGYYYELEPKEPPKCTFNSKTTHLYNRTYNAIIAGEMYANNSCFPLNDLYSLKDCEFCDRIKLDIDYDEKYPLKVIYYNYTHIEIDFETTLENEGKLVPLQIYDKYNESKKYEESYVLINTVTDKVNVLLPLGFRKVVEYGYASTTIHLDYTDMIADLTGWKSDYSTMYFDVMFPIDSIPSGQEILESKLCVYWISSSGSPDTDVTIDRIPSLTWGEGNPADGTYDNRVSEDWSTVTTSNYGCTNVTQQVDVNYVLDYDNVSLRFHDTDAITTDFDGSHSSYGYYFGQWGGVSLTANDREDTLGGGNRPFLNITYSEAATPPSTCNCTPPSPCVNWAWNFSCYCNISTDWNCPDNTVTGNDTGYWNISADINSTWNLTPESGQTIYIANGGYINITG